VPRVSYLDRARALGMVLVFYGHFVEKFATTGNNPAATLEWKIIYSFHVPLFFFLAGIFWKRDAGLVPMLIQKARTRLLPVITFSILSVPLWLILKQAQFYAQLQWALNAYLLAQPALVPVMWFLVCLFSLEVILFGLSRFLAFKPWQAWLICVLAWILGCIVLVREQPLFTGWIGQALAFAYFNVAVVAAIFYVAGLALRSVLTAAAERPDWMIMSVLCLASGAALWGTFLLPRNGPLFARPLEPVVMEVGVYGDPVLFILRAGLGICLTLSLARLLMAGFGFLEFVGQNSLIFLGLNGLTSNFLDRPFANLVGYFPHAHLPLVVYSLVYVTGVMLLLVPVVVGLKRWLPELVGSKWTPASLLPSLAGLSSQAQPTGPILEKD
jgi:acyltransferase